MNSRIAIPLLFCGFAAPCISVELPTERQLVEQATALTAALCQLDGQQRRAITRAASLRNEHFGAITVTCLQQADHHPTPKPSRKEVGA